jgi:hypothetical protein
VQLRCAATMNRTSATTSLVPKDRHRAYALQLQGDVFEKEEDLVDQLPEGWLRWHPETHSADRTKHGRIPSSGLLEHGLFTPEGSWVLYVAPRPMIHSQ